MVGYTTPYHRSTHPNYPPTALTLTQPIPTTGSPSWAFNGVSTQFNYYRSLSTSTPLVWGPAPTAIIHIWKGANISCALPYPDLTHVIIDDNVQPNNLFAALSLPQNTAVTDFQSINGQLNLSAPLSIPNGGTGSTFGSGASVVRGGVPYFSSSSGMSSLAVGQVAKPS